MTAKASCTRSFELREEAMRIRSMAFVRERNPVTDAYGSAQFHLDRYRNEISPGSSPLVGSLYCNPVK